jgi:hypothetical protein
VKQSVLPLSLVLIPIYVDFDSHAIGLVVSKVAPVNAVWE